MPLQIRRTSVASGVGGGGGSRLVGDEIFVMLNGSSDGPNYGADAYGISGSPTPTVAITHNSTGGPANRPYLHYEITATSLDEFGANWNIESPYGPPASPVVGWGGSYFIRFSYRLIGHHQQGEKLFILNPGDAQSSGDRTIINLIYESGGPGHNITAGLGGGRSVETGILTALNSWRNVQFEVRFASDASSSDGYMKLWIDNDNYSSPTSVATGIPTRWRLGTTGSEFLDFFGYHQALVSATLPRVIDVADVRLGPTFNSSWHSSGL